MKINFPVDYRDLRRESYPPQADYLDAVFKAAQGDPAPLEAYFAAVAAVKAKYPKPLTDSATAEDQGDEP